MTPHKTALIVFARYPEPGKVKTRLAATVGRDAAADFYAGCATHVVAQCLRVQSNVTRYLFYSDPGDRDHIVAWIGDGFAYHAQVGADLGERMKNAFDAVFGNGAENAVIIGTDTPDMTAELIDAAIALCRTSQFVVGPTYDGGYYLLGMSNPRPELFADMPWGTPEIFSLTLRKMTALGAGEKQCVAELLPVYHDIDTVDDLREWTRMGFEMHPLMKLAKETLDWQERLLNDAGTPA